ncbi:hypothetical protein SZ64_09105 [Erythrobacter sp. SG61-1L]|uniref:hypothetical protein n=1 Tax=Erythrobacter sp. SG61-1L TaxID=1603897 RepID=UPI0006C90D11|nr:hypothetical protein [Erythrobacter sp. SG61-1L]KPL68264.1 hypothetical protein SZ64_09105 [Erythrobacter sp. SG61-1L]
MRNSRHLHHRLDRIAVLQALKTLASRGELAEAQAATIEAQARLDDGQRNVAAKERKVHDMQAAEALDFAGWRVALAVLRDLSDRRDRAAGIARDCESREAAQREQWRRDHKREELATALLRKVGKRLADKNDEAAILEAASLRFLLTAIAE